MRVSCIRRQLVSTRAIDPGPHRAHSTAPAAPLAPSDPAVPASHRGLINQVAALHPRHMQEAELEGDPVNRMRLEQLHPERFSSVLILADESARVSASVQVRVHSRGPRPAAHHHCLLISWRIRISGSQIPRFAPLSTPGRMPHQLLKACVTRCASKDHNSATQPLRVLQVSSVGASIADADSRCLASLLLLRDIQSTRMPLTNKSMHACGPPVLLWAAVWLVIWPAVSARGCWAHLRGSSSSMRRLDMHMQPADKAHKRAHATSPGVACSCTEPPLSASLSRLPATGWIPRCMLSPPVSSAQCIKWSGIVQPPAPSPPPSLGLCCAAAHRAVVPAAVMTGQDISSMGGSLSSSRSNMARKSWFGKDLAAAAQQAECEGEDVSEESQASNAWYNTLMGAVRQTVVISEILDSRTRNLISVPAPC